MSRVIALVVLVGLIVGIVYAIRQARGHALARRHRDATEPEAKPAPARTTRTPASDAPLSHALTRWTEAGLISAEQAAAIAGFERSRAAASRVGRAAPAPQERRVPLVAEALGYLGGMLALSGVVLLVVHYWPHLATGGRLALTGAAALALHAASAAVPERADAALVRLRSFLQLAATAAVGLLALVLAHDLAEVSWTTTVVAVGGAVALHSGFLWSGRDRPAQQFAALLGAVVFAGAVAAEMSNQGAVGLTTWAVGAALLAAGLARRSAGPVLTELVGAITTIVGAAIVVGYWHGAGDLLLTASALALLLGAALAVVASTGVDELVLALVGGLALLQAVPMTLSHYADGAGMVTGLLTWAVGGVLLALGSRRVLRGPLATEALGGAALIGGAALTGTQWRAFAIILGLVTAVGLIALGMVLEQFPLSVFGSIGLLVNTPWAIAWFFPGEGRAPLLIAASGIVLVVVAVLLTRLRGGLHGPARFSRHV